jgi:hypothetical protein
MVIVYGTKEEWDTALAPRPPVRCSCCAELARPPFMYWTCEGPTGDYEGLVFCTTCCEQVRHGLTADMLRVAQIAKGMEQMQQGMPAPMQ